IISKNENTNGYQKIFNKLSKGALTAAEQDDFFFYNLLHILAKGVDLEKKLEALSIFCRAYINSQEEWVKKENIIEKVDKLINSIKNNFSLYSKVIWILQEYFILREDSATIIRIGNDYLNIAQQQSEDNKKLYKDTISFVGSMANIYKDLSVESEKNSGATDPVVLSALKKIKNKAAELRLGIQEHRKREFEKVKDYLKP
ncbi:MAG: hypothetical protein KKA19_09835, partial [Candidatus Margulisbacteria bacterium]|nr:hypothetical protein [Candidatus Margulisiibacteriota bacterium]